MPDKSPGLVHSERMLTTSASGGGVLLTSNSISEGMKRIERDRERERERERGKKNTNVLIG